jgi:hypothetical protein
MQKTKMPVITKHNVLVVREKHGDRYFYIQDTTDLHNAALRLVTERLNDGWYGLEDGPKELDYTEADLPKMPLSVRANAAIALKRHAAACDTYLRAVGEHGKIVKAVGDRDGAAAWGILESRKYNEYEVLNLESFEPREAP